MKHDLIDARGLSCPQPVLLVKKGIQGSPDCERIQVLVDNTTARDNISRFAANSGYKLEVTVQDDNFLLTLSK